MEQRLKHLERLANMPAGYFNVEETQLKKSWNKNIKLHTSSEKMGGSTEFSDSPIATYIAGFAVLAVFILIIILGTQK